MAARRPSVQEDFMQTLGALPPDHKLHRVWESHLEEVTGLQLELEKTRKLNELENLKATLAREKEKQERQRLHEDLLEEQKRAAEVIRVG